MADRVIAVNCDGPLIPLSELQPFQGTLKTLHVDQYTKLRNSIERYGLRFPIFYWLDGGVKYTLDGHQRVFVLEKMLSEGWKLKTGKVPAIAVKAKDAHEAKEMILLATSQYARMTPEGLYEFLKTNELDFIGIRDMIELPQIDLNAFQYGWMSDAPSTFDASKLPDLPTAEGTDAHVLYLAFRSLEERSEALHLLTFGKRKAVTGKQSAVNGSELLERWREVFATEVRDATG